MVKKINVSNREKAIKQLKAFKQKRYENFDIKFENVHLKDLNEVLKKNVFLKNDWYIDSSALFDIMQDAPSSNKSSHHFHNLSPEILIDCLSKLRKPLAVIVVKHGRYGIISSYSFTENSNLLLILELNSGTHTNIDAKINKIVSIYPKNKIDNYIKKQGIGAILYKK